MLSWELLDSLVLQKGCLAGRSLEENPQTQDKHHMSHTAVQSNPKWKLLWCSCLGCLGPLSWAVVRFTVLPSHLQFLCLNIFSTVKWVKNESKTHTIMLWVAWGEVCTVVQIWLCCSRWGEKNKAGLNAEQNLPQCYSFAAQALRKDTVQHFLWWMLCLSDLYIN